MNKSTILEAVGITKKYGALTAVNDLNLAVPEGACLGLLGPNGAGKTTLVEIIEGIISPTSGQVLYRGKNRDASFRENIGIMFQQTALLGYMRVHDTLKIFQSLYPDTLDVEDLIHLCYLDDIRKQFNDKISGGQRQRLLLALALINRPDLLFLDEPSTGLDPQARRNLWDIVTTVKNEGKTIILTTHYMEEAEQLCDIVAIMDHGQIIAQGNPSELIAQHTQGMNILLPIECKDKLPSNHDLFEITLLKNQVVLQVSEINAVLETLLGAGVDLSHIIVQSPSLETVFLNLTGRQLRD